MTCTNYAYIHLGASWLTCTRRPSAARKSPWQPAAAAELSETGVTLQRLYIGSEVSDTMEDRRLSKWRVILSINLAVLSRSPVPCIPPPPPAPHIKTPNPKRSPQRNLRNPDN